jgi:hypothetical protein
MFTFILRLQAWMEKLKKNKGLWFTSISVASVIGITLSLYYILSMNDRAADAVFKQFSEEVITQTDNLIEVNYEKLLAVAAVVGSSNVFQEAIAADDNARIGTVLSTGAQNVSAVLQSNIRMRFFDAEGNFRVGSDENASRGLADMQMVPNGGATGIDVDTAGVVLYVSIPVQDSNGEQLGSVMVSQPLYHLYDSVSQMGRELLVTMRPGHITRRMGPDTEPIFLGESYATVQQTRNESFLINIDEVGIETILSGNFHTDANFYTTHRPIRGYDGEVIGHMLLGQPTGTASSMVDFTQDVTRGTTIAAMGLVLALLMLMV